MFEVRPTRDREEFGRALYGIAQYFGGPPTEEQLERFNTHVPLDRMHAAFDDGVIVGGAGAFPFEMSVPGGELRCGGVTVVGVYPTHRRRGALRAMMDAQLRDIHERGEPIAALWASEETIYGRYGYGIASWMGEVAIPREWGAFARPLEQQGRVRLVTQEEALPLLRVPDEEKSNPKRIAVIEFDGEPQAYAIYKSEMSWDGGVSTTKLHVTEAIGVTDQAMAEIWRYLLDIDWQATIHAELLPPDHPLFTLLANPRRAKYRMGDMLWVRLVDVGAALSGRAYAGAGAVVFEVHDAVCLWNEGRWRVSPEGAERTDADAEIVLDVATLGAAYLGATSFAQLRGGLRLEEISHGAVERADALFSWRPLPWCPEIF